MGTPSPNPDPPYEPGVDCDHCTPDTWESGKTPLYLNVELAGISLCTKTACLLGPAPPNKIWKLTQLVGAPCIWKFEDADWQVEFHAFYSPTGGSYLRAYHVPTGHVYFQGQDVNPCKFEFDNMLDCAWSWVCGYGGTGKVY